MRNGARCSKRTATMDGSIARPRPFLALGLRLLTALSLATMSMLMKQAGENGASKP